MAGAMAPGSERGARRRDEAEAAAGLSARELACVRGERGLFADISFDLAPGQCLHVAGDNGAGKTSLLRILAGLLAPAGGQVLWRGRELARAREEFASDLAFVGHLNGIKDDLTVLENVQLAGAVRGSGQGQDAAREALRAMGLEDYAQLLARHLSQGQKRRVALARLCTRPAAPLWILDEPFNALDAGSVAGLRALIEARLAAGGIVVLTAHQPVELPAGARRLELAGEPPA
jgi:heme exporter protein A